VVVLAVLVLVVRLALAAQELSTSIFRSKNGNDYL
jgi:hypothetical protein